MINEVQDLAHFSNLVKQTKARIKSLKTNCYLFPQEITKYCEQHRLFFEENVQGLLFLRERPECYSFYFYLSLNQEGNEPFEAFSLTKPFVLDLTFTEPDTLSPIAETRHFWQTKGFSFYKRYQQMSQNIADPDRKLKACQLFEKQKDRFNVKFAQAADAPRILELWKSSLDELSTALPELDELELILNAHQVLACHDNSGQIIAALQIFPYGKIAAIDHVVVDRAYRNLGLGTVLLNGAIALQNEFQKFVLWVDVNNFPAKTLYEKQDYLLTGKISDQLLYSKQREQ